MRVEPYGVGSYLHIVKRGARGLPLAEDVFDRERFLRSLYYMNDRHLDQNWDRILSAKSFARPEVWPKRRPLTRILAFTLMPNHMHLLLEETQDGGVSAFMQKLGQSMTNHHNEKYGQHGSIFQGAYRSRTIETDIYLRYVSAYIMVKNVFELYPVMNPSHAVGSFDQMWEWAVTYPYSSLGHYALEKTPIIDPNVIEEMFNQEGLYKRFARDVMESRLLSTVEFE